jgi:phospholipid N-methyltransferase
MINSVNANLSVRERAGEHFTPSVYDSSGNIFTNSEQFREEEGEIWQLRSFSHNNETEGNITSEPLSIEERRLNQSSSFYDEKDGADIIESPGNKKNHSFFMYMGKIYPVAYFFINFLFHPKETGAIFPSSAGLAKKMMMGVKNHIKNLSSLSKESDQLYKILELGAGSGVFTEEIIRNEIPEKSIFLVESQENFSRFLEEKFPKVTLMKGHVQDLLKKHPHFEKNFPVIISGIPFKNIFNPEERQEILNVIFRCLKEGGFLRQFTYRFSSPIISEELEKVEEELGCKIEVKYEGYVFKNFPPAKVYKYTLVKPKTFSFRVSQEMELED